MPIGAGFTISNATPAHGEKITGTYTVTGNTGTPAGSPNVVHGTATAAVGSDQYGLTFDLTIPGTPAVPPLAETFFAPVSAGVSWAPTADPKVWEGTVA
jgi:hypothetical protein